MNTIKRTIRRFNKWLLNATDDWEPVEPGWSEELYAELALHPGEWVAIAPTHDRLAAAGGTPTEVLAAARLAGVEGAILYEVPLPGVIQILAATGA